MIKTKQEEIREGMEHILKMKEMTKVTRDAILEYQLKFLKSEGVVLKVGGETFASICGYCESLDTCREEHSECDKFRLSTGLTAYEELI